MNKARRTQRRQGVLLATLLLSLGLMVGILPTTALATGDETTTTTSLAASQPQGSEVETSLPQTSMEQSAIEQESEAAPPVAAQEVQPFGASDIYPVVTQADLENALTSIAGLPDKNGVITVAGTLTMTACVDIPINVSVTLTGGGTLRAPSSKHFLVEGTLVLDKITLDGGDSLGGILAEPGSTVTLLEGAYIQNCYAPFTAEARNGAGSAIYMSGADVRINLYGGVLRGNESYSSGTIFFEGCSGGMSTIHMTGGAIENNTVGSFGGGIYANQGMNLLMEGGRISGNGASDWYSNGGGVNIGSNLVYPSYFTMTGGTITDNEAATGGGVTASGIHMHTIIDGGTITGNRAEDGAGLAAQMGHVELRSGTISGNEALYSGGGFFVHDDAQLTITGGTLSGNRANWGAGIYVFDNAVLDIEGGTFNGNIATPSASSEGGAIFAGTGSSGTISGGIFTGNAADYGGALVAYQSTLAITGGTFTGNRADDAGAIAVADATLNMRGVLISGNTAGYYGGGVYVSGSGTLNLRDSTLSGNSAQQRGGALYVAGAAVALDIENTEISGNTSATGGAVYTANLTKVAARNTTFRDNFATSGAAKLTDGTDIATHTANIVGCTFSTPASLNAYGYNNYDISYTGTAGLYYRLAYWWNYEDPDTQYETGFYQVGEPITTPEPPARFGYDFGGWHTDKACTTPSALSAMPAQNVDLYAKWTPRNQHTVTFVAGVGLANPQPQQVYVGYLVEAPTQPLNTGHSLVGWFTDPADDNTLWRFAADPMPDTPLTLYAVWEINEYTVTFDYGYSNKRVPVDVVYGQRIPAPVDTNRTGYTFGGWLYNGAQWDFSSPMPARNITLVAVWTPVTTSGGGGGEQSSSSSAVTSRPSSSATGSSSAGSSSSQSSSSQSQPSSSAVAAGSVSQAPQESEPSGTLPAPIGADGGRGAPGDADYIQPNGSLGLFGAEVPLGGFASRGGWSLVNLLLGLAMLASSAVLYARMLARNRRGQSMEDLEYDPAAPRKRVLLPLALVPLGLLPLGLLPLLEQFSLGMMLISRWTPLYLAFVLVHVVVWGTAVLRSRMRRPKQ